LASNFNFSKLYIIKLISKVYTYKILIIFTLIFNISFVFAQIDGKNNKNDSIKIAQSGSKDTIKIKAERLEDVVDYKANDITNDIPKKMSYLIKNAKVNYQDMKINADFISIDWNSGDVYARSEIDSLGKIKKRTTFEQGGKTFKYDSFKFNFKTKQGVVYNTQTIEGSGIINAEISKKVNDSIYLLRRAKYTTDDYYIKEKDSLADYYLQLNKAKFIQSENTKVAIAGVTNMVIEETPTPLFLPFLFIPLSNENRVAGILIPTFGERDREGFFLQGGGFYVPFGDTFDMALTADFYTKGSFGIHEKTQYKKRYKYSGNISMDYEKIISSTKGLDDYSNQSNYRVAWSHSQDAKANPYSRFTANVNFSSTNYFKNSVTNRNIVNGSFLNNNTNSAISWTKTFEKLPLSISANASYTQDLTKGNSSLTFPTITASLQRQFPFRKENTKSELAKSFYLDYNAQATNSLSGGIDTLFSSASLKKAKTGIKQHLSFGTGLNLFTYYPVNFSANYDEVWGLKSVNKFYDTATNKLVTEDINKFSSYRTFNTSVGISSTWYATKVFKKGSKIAAIRHTITPSVSYNFTPDFTTESWNYFGIVRDNNGKKTLYNRYENNIYGGPSSSGLSSSIGISIANNLEMKIKTKNDSLEYKKIKIFDFMNISTGYNIAADSLNWSNISVTAATSLFDTKLRVNYGLNINPYKIVFDSEEATTGYNVNKFGNFSISNYTVGLNFSLNNELLFGKKKEYEKLYKKKGKIRYENYFFDDENYAHFAIPWDVNIGVNYVHTLGFSRTATNTATVNLSGNIEPTPYWKIAVNTNYDIIAKEFNFTTFTLSRDIRSFVINFTWVPFGNVKTWDFFIGIKADILKDAVKYNTQEYINR